MDAPTSHGMPRIAHPHLKLGELHRTDSSSEPIEGASPAETLTFSYQNCERMHSYCVKPPSVCGTLFMAALELIDHRTSH